ncbi:MAG: hypothetical protein KF690_12385 [Bacteroidetes bacterium]|nr:hypothetical protein [Bacteroidota bacterium]
MKTLLLLIGTCLPFSLGAQDLTALDTEYGFLGVRLGTPADSIPGLVRDGSFEKKDRYVPRVMPRQVHNITVTRVEYLFWENRLHSIRIRTEGNPATEQLRELLEIYYGEYQQRGLEGFYSWQGRLVRLEMEENLISRNAWTTFTSLEADRAFSRVWRRD